MKLMAGRSWLAAVAMLGVLSFAAHGDGDSVGTSTQDLLIEKLEHVYKNLAPSDASKLPVTLRLADLYADRARVASMKELDSGCTVCEAGTQDRAKALRLYQEALPKTPESQRGRVLVQVASMRPRSITLRYWPTIARPHAGLRLTAWLGASSIKGSSAKAWANSRAF
jgi:hypothetical protein